ncbi:hypothetical protein N7452_001323 [Penicillium brevicompactum]|uniref:NACHT domain-containing protein n=1 Tax=Penicillium brevicompactum TaxID=5074 RepID=A0A9W9R4D0_PENBR|nr:hypothetical protein N7452_001323 [Penicillium brevicompactum]
MWKKIKSKVHRHKHGEQAEKRSVESKSQSTSAPVRSGEANEVDQPIGNTALPGDPSPVSEVPAKKSPEQTQIPPKDLWQDAFRQLSEYKQDKLREMGFENFKANSIESNIDDLVSVVNKKQEECEKKFLRVSVAGEDIVLRNYTTQIVGWIEKAGDIAMNFAPPQVSLPWGLIKNMLQIPVNESEQMGALLAATERIVRITSRGQVYEQVYLPQARDTPLDGVQKGLESSLLQIYTTSLDLLVRSGDLLSAGTAKRTLEAIVNPGQVSDSVSDLGKQEDELLRDVQACESKRSAAADERTNAMLEALNAPMTRIDEGVSRLLQHMNESERISMLEFISPIPFGKHHDNIKEERVPGTGEWLMQNAEFRSWEDKSSSGLFWLHGSPGTGKTYVTSRVVDHIQDRMSDLPKDEGFAFFYCDKTETARSQPLSILQSLVRQLSTCASNPESVQAQLSEACKDMRKQGTNFRLPQCKQQILDSLNMYQRTTLVIDAMDECEEESRYQLIATLNYLLSESQRPVKIFVSSRPDPDIQSEFDGSLNAGISASDNTADIHAFLSVQLDRLAKNAPFLKHIKTSVIDRFLKGCQGMFQWASLQIHQMTKCRSESSVWNRLNRLPEDLQAAYEEVWADIKSLEEPDQTMVKRALYWTMAATRPMSSDELLSAIRIGSDGEVLPLGDKLDEQGLLSLCNNFLAVDPKVKVWRFPHLSIREFLEKNHGWSLSNAQTYAASACLSYMINTYDDANLDEGENEQWENKKTGESDDGFDRFHPFHLYLRHSWFQHLQALNGTENIELKAILCQFLGSAYSSSLQYRRWAKWATGDLLTMSLSHKRQYYTGDYFSSTWPTKAMDELAPSDSAIFAVCLFSLTSVFLDWWEEGAVDVACKNEMGNNLLIPCILGNNLPMCQLLVEGGIGINFIDERGSVHDALSSAAGNGRLEILKCFFEAGMDKHSPFSEKNDSSMSGPLAAALSSNNAQIVKYLVEEVNFDISIKYVGPGATYIGPDQALLLASRRSDIELLKILFKAGADVNTIIRDDVFTSTSYTALSLKASRGQLEGVKYLIREAKADVNMPIPGGRFGHALEASTSLVITKFLVEEAGANVNMQSTSGKRGNALVSACCENLEMVQYLVEAGADINMPLHIGAYGSALAAACTSDIEIVKYIVEAGADINMPLHIGAYGSALAAACTRDIEIVKYIVEAGADINMPLESGRYHSVLAAACTNDIEIVKFLVEAGADINVPLEGHYGSALAAACQANIESVRYLVQAGADINMPLHSGAYGSALAAACTNDVEIVKFLVEAGADINVPLEGRYGSALAAACTARIGDLHANTEIVNYLVEAGANLSMALPNPRFGCAFTISAVSTPMPSAIMEVLIKAGVDVNVQHPDANYGTPLIAAACLGSTESVNCLIEAGADVNLKLAHNNRFTTALEAALAELSEEDKEWILFDNGPFFIEFDIAERKENKLEIVEILKKHMVTV